MRRGARARASTDPTSQGTDTVADFNTAAVYCASSSTADWKEG